MTTAEEGRNKIKNKDFRGKINANTLELYSRGARFKFQPGNPAF
jgi:hypothetical protein